jgi:hypothetical protein
MLDARVKILFVLAHDHDIHDRMLGVDERMIRNARAYIRIQSESFPHRHVQAFVSAALRSSDRGL